MAVLNFLVTPANVHDSKLFVPLLSDTQHLASFPDITAVYGDNAYDSDLNKSYLEKGGIEARFHSKDETGKKPKYSKSAKQKSKKRSKIEVLFGISKENLGFGSVKVRTLRNVQIDTAIIFSGWNLGILYSYFVNRIADRLSLKKLMYKN